MAFAKASNKALTQRSESYCYLYYKEMDWPAAGLEYDARAVGCVLCRPHAGLTGCNRNVKSRDERRLTPPPLTSPRSAVIFVEKAAAACAAPALKYFCSILHHNLAFTQNLGLTPKQLDHPHWTLILESGSALLRPNALQFPQNSSSYKQTRGQKVFL